MNERVGHLSSIHLLLKGGQVHPPALNIKNYHHDHPKRPVT